MKINTKIKAFTLSEMLVVLVISSIVISIAFLTLSMVQKQIGTIRKNMANKQEIQFFERILWNDFNSYAITYFEKEDKLLFKNPIEALEYEFNEEYILRKQDSFLVKINEKQFFLDGKEVKTGAVDAVKIQTSPAYGNTSFFIFTTKDASFYMNE